MTTTFYYADGSTRVLNSQQPVSQNYLADLVHDFRGSLLPPRQEAITPLTADQRLKEKAKLDTEKHAHKKAWKLKTPLFSEQRDELIRALLGCKMPNWGSVKLTVVR